ncbi:MAG TPA: DinB family protein [Chitinophagaceae bacterium]|nr:DinB family protein [Chitinophagaceae bacterium]
MNKQLQKLEKLRHFLLKEISSLTTEQLNTIPDGFSNNIIWNLAHLVSATQLIFYKRAGLPLTIHKQYITPFLPGSKPGTLISNEDIDAIKELSISTIGGMQTDYENQSFDNYKKSENLERYYGIEVLTIEDAIEFLLYHEGYHSGKIIALKHLV